MTLLSRTYDAAVHLFFCNVDITDITLTSVLDMQSNKFNKGFAKYEYYLIQKSNCRIGGTCPHLLIYMKSASSSELLDS